jgi:hypothetical protein
MQVQVLMAQWAQMAQTVIMDLRVDREVVMVIIPVASVQNQHLVEMAAPEDRVL